MPLLLMCGYPCSGKSTVVQLIVEQLHARLPDSQVVLVAEPVSSSLGVPEKGDQDMRSQIYANSQRERELRGQHKSEIEHAITGANNQKTSIIIMDGPNYIKGYRYELYCLAKSLKHQHAVIWCDTPASTCFDWNEKINRYSKQCLSDMIDRFESPQSSCRWDSPLLTIHPDHFGSSPEVDCTEIVDELIGIFAEKSKTNVRPNKSTLLNHVAPTNFLQELERSIQSIIDHILTCQSVGANFADLPKSILVQLPPGSDLLGTRLSLIGHERQLTLANLARMKRQFIHVQTAKISEPQLASKPMTNCATIAAGFLIYLCTVCD